MKEKRFLRRTFGLLAAAMLSLSLTPLFAVAEESYDLPADAPAVVAAEVDAALEQDVAAPEAPAPEVAAPEAAAPAPEATAPAPEATAPALEQQLTAAPAAELPEADQVDNTHLEVFTSPGTVSMDTISNVDANGISQYIIYGKNIPVQGGTYWYKLLLKETGALIFDNDLRATYQGVDGKYKLHYAMPASGENHHMVADGSFDNVLTTSPLLPSTVTSKITNDNYTYKLDLLTEEGFTFNNKLQYKYSGAQYGYYINYGYDLATDTQTLDAGDLAGNKVNPAILERVTQTLKTTYDTLSSISYSANSLTSAFTSRVSSVLSGFSNLRLAA